MKIKKKVPELRFPEFSGEWEEKKLGDLVNFYKGKGISKSDLSEQGIPCILYGELYTTYGEVINNVKSKTELKENLFMSKINDVIIPSSGETAEDISCASVVLLDNIALGGDLNILRPSKNIDGCFLSYILNSSKKKDIARVSQGISVIHVYEKGLKQLDINFPSLPEQQKIGNFFFTLDKRIELQQQKVENLEKEKKWIMQKIFSQEIRVKDKNGNDYPEWEKKKLEEMVDSGDVELGRGKVISKRYIEENPGNNPVYSSSIINDGIMGYTNDYMFNEELITWSIDGGGNFFYRNKHRFSVTNVSGIMKVNTRKYNYKFIHSQLEILHSQLKFDYIAKAHPSVIVGIYTLMLPSLPEQQKIANFLSAFDNKIEKEREKLEQLRELKRGLLQKMFV